MTTKPKARKFRIKRNAGSGGSPRASAAATAEATAPELSTPQEEARPEPRRSRTAKSEEAGPKAAAAKPDARPDAPKTAEAPATDNAAGATDIDAIRKEGLTGRQLRMARRVAQKNGLAPTSDFDAVKLLREQGIDPFERSNMLELVVPNAEEGGDAEAAKDGPKTKTAAAAPKSTATPVPAEGRVQLPQTVPAGGALALPGMEEENPAVRREREISEIQRDITKRRRKKLRMLVARLAFFVLIPTLIAGIYFYRFATPMYATNSQFLIIQSEGGGGSSPFGGILPTQFANSADSIATQAYLQSKDAMLRLDQDVGFKDHFAEPGIDPIQRLEPNATNEEAYKLYKKNVKIGYDPTEGVIRLEVIAADPHVSASFSESLIEYAEERVNDLSRQKREDGMSDALEGFEIAQQKRRDAQEALIKLQVENGVDPEAEIIAIRSQITTYEGLLIEKELELAALMDNPRPNQAKVDGARGDVRRLNVQLDRLRDKMSSATIGEGSLAQQAVTMQLAQADLAAADMVLQSAQTALEQARTEAGRQVRYLTVAVHPVAPEEATYPRKFENTILAFLIFAGIYLMLSLTSAILREQVTS